MHTMFTAALSTTAKTWNQPKCPLADERMKIWYIDKYKGILLSFKKRCHATCSNKDGPRDDHTK